MDDILSWLWRGLTSIFQWALIQGFLYSVGAGVIWIFTLGKYPTKESSVDNFDYIVIFGFFVLVGLLNISYWIFKLS